MFRKERIVPVALFASLLVSGLSIVMAAEPDFSFNLSISPTNVISGQPVLFRILLYNGTLSDVRAYPQPYIKVKGPSGPFATALVERWSPQRWVKAYTGQYVNAFGPALPYREIPASGALFSHPGTYTLQYCSYVTDVSQNICSNTVVLTVSAPSGSPSPRSRLSVRTAPRTR